MLANHLQLGIHFTDHHSYIIKMYIANVPSVYMSLVGIIANQNQILELDSYVSTGCLLCLYQLDDVNS